MKNNIEINYEQNYNIEHIVKNLEFDFEPYYTWKPAPYFFGINVVISVLIIFCVISSFIKKKIKKLLLSFSIIISISTVLISFYGLSCNLNYGCSCIDTKGPRIIIISLIINILFFIILWNLILREKKTKK